MTCNRATTKKDHGHDVSGAPLRCGTPLYYTDGGPKVVRTEIVRCEGCREAEKALEEATKPKVGAY
jgi:hypothetical protein